MQHLYLIFVVDYILNTALFCEVTLDGSSLCLILRHTVCSQFWFQLLDIFFKLIA